MIEDDQADGCGQTMNLRHVAAGFLRIARRGVGAMREKNKPRVPLRVYGLTRCQHGLGPCHCRSEIDTFAALRELLCRGESGHCEPPTRPWLCARLAVFTGRSSGTSSSRFTSCDSFNWVPIVPIVTGRPKAESVDHLQEIFGCQPSIRQLRPRSREKLIPRFAPALFDRQEKKLRKAAIRRTKSANARKYVAQTRLGCDAHDTQAAIEKLTTDGRSHHRFWHGRAQSPFLGPAKLKVCPTSHLLVYGGSSPRTPTRSRSASAMHSAEKDASIPNERRRDDQAKTRRRQRDLGRSRRAARLHATGAGASRGARQRPRGSAPRTPQETPEDSNIESKK